MILVRVGYTDGVGSSIVVVRAVAAEKHSRRRSNSSSKSVNTEKIEMLPKV